MTITIRLVYGKHLMGNYNIMLVRTMVVLFSVLFYSCSQEVDGEVSKITTNNNDQGNGSGLYKGPSGKLFKKYPLKKYTWTEKKRMAQSLIIGTTTQQEVINLFGIDAVGRSHPPVVDSLIYHCKKGDEGYPGDEWLKFLSFDFNGNGKLVRFYEVTVPYPVPH